MRQVVQAAGLACGRSGCDFTRGGTSTDLGGFELHDAILQFVGTNCLPFAAKRVGGQTEQG